MKAITLGAAAAGLFVAGLISPASGEAAVGLHRPLSARVAPTLAPSRTAGPMSPPTQRYRISTRFGQRGSWATGWHTGLDMATRSGTAVVAALAGRVTRAGWMGAYGRAVKIRHANGVSTFYAHMSSIAVRAGRQVLAEQTIGRVGSTGNSSGPHLHFEVRQRGRFKDPARYLPEDARGRR